MSPSFFDSFMNSCSESSSWLTGARTEEGQADSRMMCVKNAHITKEYTLIWDLSEYQSAFHDGSVEGQGLRMQVQSLLHSRTASRLQRMNAQIHGSCDSVCHICWNPDIIVMHRNTLHHARLRKCPPEHRLSFAMIAECEKLQTLSVKHSHPELSGRAAASFRWCFHESLSYQSFSKRWNNGQQEGKWLTVIWSIYSDLCALPHNLSFPSISFFPAFWHLSIPWDNRTCSNSVTVKIRLFFFPFFFLIYGEITEHYQCDNFWRGPGLC